LCSILIFLKFSSPLKHSFPHRNYLFVVEKKFETYIPNFSDLNIIFNGKKSTKYMSNFLCKEKNNFKKDKGVLRRWGKRIFNDSPMDCYELGIPLRRIIPSIQYLTTLN
jgi:hypothetical protein